jgi:diguanylate cyclase (GGDEF)-like protein
VLVCGLLVGAAGVALNGVSGAFAAAVGDWSLTVCFAAAAISVTWRAVTMHGERVPWSLMAAGLWIYCLGTAVFVGWISGMDAAPFPSVADWLWLCLPIFSLAGFVVLGRSRGTTLRLVSVLDGVIVAAAFAGLVAAFVYGGVYDEFMERGVGFGMVLPLAELAVVSTLLVGAAARRWRPEPAAVFAGVGFATVAFGDCVYSLAAASSGWTPGTWIDVPYIAGISLFALGAWLPVRAAPAGDGSDGRALIIPLAAGSVSVVLVAAAVFTELNPVAEGATVLLVAAVAARMALALRSSALLLSSTREEAMTDALTGLGNRRRLLVDLGEPDAPPRTLMLFDLDGFKTYNDTCGHAAGDVLLAMLAGRLGATVSGWGTAYRMGGDEFCVLLPAGAPDLRDRAGAALRTEAEGIAITCSWGEVTIPREAASPEEALRIADRRMYAMKNGRPSAPGAQLREALTRVMAIREPDLHEHVLDVGRMAADVGRRLGVPEHDLVDIVHGAELHDVGKLAIPEAILDKAGPLDDDEWAVMRNHTILGEQLLSGIPALVNAARLVRASHERWDGGGYPDGTAGSAIPLGARIIAVCDAYDAMVTDRPYRAGMSHAEAVAELRRCAASQFDPQVVTSPHEHVMAIPSASVRRAAPARSRRSGAPAGSSTQNSSPPMR